MKFGQHIEDIYVHIHAKYRDDTRTRYEAVLYYSCKNADIYLMDVADVEIWPPSPSLILMKFGQDIEDI